MTRATLTTALLSIATLAILAATAVVLLSGRRLAPAPFAYSRAVYQPVAPVVCQNGALDWQSEIVIDRPPVVVFRHRTIWSVAQRRTVWSDPEPTYAIWLDPDTVKNALHFDLPQLPIGAYELRTAGVGEGTETAAYRVPFTVRRCEDANR